MNVDGLIVKNLKAHIDHRGYLIECWRNDYHEFQGFSPEMMYASISNPGVRRGAHLHIDQRDLFIFIGPGNFRVVVADNRQSSMTYQKWDSFYVGENNPAAVLIPTNCWHGYENVSSTAGMVINIPDSLYRGKNYSEKVDEVRKSWTDLCFELDADLWEEIVD